MQTMREKIARRLALENGHSGTVESAWRLWLGSADAALEELRQPTEGMLDACGSGACGKWALGAWTVMIDHALNEEIPTNTKKERE